MPPPVRYLTPDQMDVAQLVRHQQGERIETPEYVAARNAALVAAGLEPINDPDAFDLENATVEDHLHRIRRTR